MRCRYKLYVVATIGYRECIAQEDSYDKIYGVFREISAYNSAINLQLSKTSSPMSEANKRNKRYKEMIDMTKDEIRKLVSKEIRDKYRHLQKEETIRIGENMWSFKDCYDSDREMVFLLGCAKIEGINIPLVS